MTLFQAAFACKAKQKTVTREAPLTLVILGAKGTGKSSMAISLLGYDPAYPHPWAKGNGCFEASNERKEKSHTKLPCQLQGTLFYYDSHLPKVTVIDTPGTFYISTIFDIISTLQ